MSEAYRALLAGVADQLGLSPQALGETQELVIDELAVGLDYDGDEQVGDVVFFARLGQPGESRRLVVYTAMLEANNFWIGTGGATLAIQSDTQEVLMCGRVPVDGTTAPGLVQVLDVFVEAALFWKLYIQEAPESAPAWDLQRFSSAV